MVNLIFLRNIGMSRLEKLNVKICVCLTNIEPSVNTIFSSNIQKSSIGIRVETLWKKYNQTHYLQLVSPCRFSSANTIKPFRYAVIYDENSDRVIAYADFGETIQFTTSEEYFSTNWESRCIIIEW